MVCLSAISVSLAEAQPKEVRLSDEQIVRLAIDVNAYEVQMGEFAAEKAVDVEVKFFGQAMARDHRDLMIKITALAERRNLPAMSTNLSEKLKTETDEAYVELQGTDAAGFDRAYIIREVKYLQEIVELLDQKLLPNVQREELRTMLITLRTIFGRDLNRVKVLLAGAK